MEDCDKKIPIKDRNLNKVGIFARWIACSSNVLPYMKIHQISCFLNSPDWQQFDEGNCSTLQRNTGNFSSLSGILLGKVQDNIFEEIFSEFNTVYAELFSKCNPDLE